MGDDIKLGCDERFISQRKGQTMAWLKFTTLAAVAVLSGAMMVHAEGTGEAKPEAEKAAKVEKSEKKAKVAKPYSEIESLSDEQKQQIIEIRKRIAAEIKALQAKEDEEIAAILTDDQKTELAKLKEEQLAKKKKAKEAGEATTQPAM